MPSQAPDVLESEAALPGGKGSSEMFAYWAKCEDIATHFNELTIRFRLQALGGVAVVAAVLGYAKGTSMLSAGMLHLGVGVVICFWIGTAMIDFVYYGRLLEGAVGELLRIEAASGGALRLSSAIEAACRDTEKPWWCHQTVWTLLDKTGLSRRAVRGRLWFYLVPAAGLLVVLFR